MKQAPLFISHKGADKRRLQPFLSRLLRQGVPLSIDNTNEFDREFASTLEPYLRSGLITLLGPTYWKSGLVRAIRSCACTLGFISNASCRPGLTEEDVQFSEMAIAWENEHRLVIVQLDEGAVDRFTDMEHLDAYRMRQCQYFHLREDRYNLDFTNIGRAVALRSQGQIQFSSNGPSEALVTRQAALAKRVRGAEAHTRVIIYELGMPVQFTLIPGAGANDTGYFWLSTTPISADPVPLEEVEAVLAGAPGVRLPTVKELAWALRPLGDEPHTPNPFGIDATPAAPVWTGPDAAIAGEGAKDARAFLYLVRKGPAARSQEN